jgi:cell division protein FtsQ
MRKTITIRKKSRRRGGRRSQTRLGARPIRLETSVPNSILTLKPAIKFWQVNRSRIVGLLVLAFLAWIMYLLFDLDDFYVYEAEIKGNHVLTAEEIYAASGVDSQSVFWLNPQEIAANVEILPNIKTARIYLTLPANLTIEVEERQPEVIWQTGDDIWWIDNEGLFVPPRNETEVDENRLRIVDRDGFPVRANDRLDLSIVRGAQIVHEHKPEIKDFMYTRQYGLIYQTPTGWPVYLGRSNDLPAKLIVAQALQADLLARQVTPLFIDVRNPSRAIYKEQQEF